MFDAKGKIHGSLHFRNYLTIVGGQQSYKSIIYNSTLNLKCEYFLNVKAESQSFMWQMKFIGSVVK